MVQQPVDHGGGESIIEVEDLAPLLEDAIGRDDNRSGLISLIRFEKSGCPQAPLAFQS